MKKISKEQKEKLKAGLSLLCEETTTLDKINKIASLAKGFSPKIDKKLEVIKEIAEKLQKISGGDVIGLSAEKLPEKTKKDKQRKKLLLLLLASWKDLGAEIARIGHLQAAGLGTGGTVVETGKIVATMKGPLGLVTIGAAGIVAVSTILNNAAVEINVRNQGCRPIEPVIEKTIDIPGLKLPSAEISNGKSDVVKIPGLSMMVRINRGQISLSAFNMERGYDLPNEITDIIYDGESLMGKTTKLELGSAKKHNLVLICNNKQ